jgi:hypothetical protein
MRKLYIGIRQPLGCVVYIHEGQLNDEMTDKLPDATWVRNFSPDGFEWGYAGSGPSQLALAILVDAVGEDRALLLYQDFARAVVARLPRHAWELSADDVREWVAEQEATLTVHQPAD